MRRRTILSAVMGFLLVLFVGGTLSIFVDQWISAPLPECRATPLMFHRVVPSRVLAARYDMPESVFVRQMEELRAAGAQTRQPLDLVRALARPAAPGVCPFLPHEVVITFDLDGASRDQEIAAPVLDRLGFHAVFFAPTGFIDHGGAITSQELRALAASGMSVGSHSEYHLDMRYEVSDSMVASLVRSRKVLQDLTGQPILLLSAPGGRYDARVVRDVPKAGFEGFFTSDPCYLSSSASPFRLCRIEIRGDGGMTATEALHSSWRVALQGALWKTKRLVETIGGRRLWSVLHSLRGAQ